MAGHPARLACSLSMAMLTSACALLTPGATFPAGTLEVVVNRTTTPVLTGVGLVGPCEEMVVDQKALDAWAAVVATESGPPLPAGVVDLSNVAGDIPGSKGPLIWIITADDSNKFSDRLDRASLPQCAGEAQPVVYPE